MQNDTKFHWTKYLISCRNVLMILSHLLILWNIQEETWTGPIFIKFKSLTFLSLGTHRGRVPAKVTKSCRLWTLRLWCISLYFNWDIVIRMSKFCFETMAYNYCKGRIYCSIVIYLFCRQRYLLALFGTIWTQCILLNFAFLNSFLILIKNAQWTAHFFYQNKLVI